MAVFYLSSSEKVGSAFRKHAATVIHKAGEGDMIVFDKMLIPDVGAVATMLREAKKGVTLMPLEEHVKPEPESPPQP